MKRLEDYYMRQEKTTQERQLILFYGNKTKMENQRLQELSRKRTDALNLIEQYQRDWEYWRAEVQERLYNKITEEITKIFRGEE